MLTFEQLRKANVDRCNDAFHDVDSWDINDWAVAMGGEVGEAVEAFGKLLSFLNTAKKLKRLEDADSADYTPEKYDEMRWQLGIEIADWIIYGDLLLHRLQLKTESVIVKKFNEVSDKRGSEIKL